MRVSRIAAQDGGAFVCLAAASLSLWRRHVKLWPARECCARGQRVCNYDELRKRQKSILCASAGRRAKDKDAPISAPMSHEAHKLILLRFCPAAETGRNRIFILRTSPTRRRQQSRRALDGRPVAGRYIIARANAAERAAHV